MTYRLSNRQRKELLVRRAEIAVAIPLPLDWPDGATDAQLREFVRRALPEVRDEWLRDVTEEWLAIDILRAAGDVEPFGRIIDATEAAKTTHLVVSVAVAVVSQDRPRHKRARVQWVQTGGTEQ